MEALADVDLRVDSKADFQVEANMTPVFEALKQKGLNPEMRRDEEHSAHAVVFRDSTGAERSIGLALSAQPEYRRYRALARSISRFNEPPFVVVKNERRDSQPNWGELLEYVKNGGQEGRQRAALQRAWAK